MARIPTYEEMEQTVKELKGEYWESVEIPIVHKNGDIRIALWNSANIYVENSTSLLATIAQGMDIKPDITYVVVSFSLNNKGNFSMVS